MTEPERDQYGRWSKGMSGNPQGRRPRQQELKYLKASMGAVSVEDWEEITRLAVKHAKDESDWKRADAARRWLTTIVIPPLNQVQRLEQDTQVVLVVQFGAQESGGAPLPDPNTIDGQAWRLEDKE